MSNGRVHWISQSYVPRRMVTETTNLALIDKNHFIFATNNLNDYFETHSYDINQETWSTIFEIENASAIAPFISYDPISKRIFISLSNQLKVYDTQKQKLEGYTVDIPLYSQIIVIDGICHIIGYTNNGLSHHIVNVKTQRIQDIHIYNDMNGIGYYDKVGLVYNSKKKELLIIGECSSSNQRMNPFYKYSVVNNKWTKLNIKLPHSMHHGAYVITKDGRYIIILGGKRANNYAWSDDVFVCDLESMEFVESDFKLPSKPEM